MSALILPARRGVQCDVAVLFARADSIYKSIPGCDVFDADRDARTFAGGMPVVAHPPCQLWGAMASVNYARWGGEHNRPGNDGGLFEFALSQVHQCGGVLEHPAKSRAWAAHGLTKPFGYGWQLCAEGWACEVWQSAFGHRANKATWLYCVGLNPPPEPPWLRPIGTHQVGFYDQRGNDRNKPTLSKREANSTPVAFAHWLVVLAQSCKPLKQKEAA